MASQDDVAKRDMFLRRRRLGVLLGAFLALLFGGWLGLGLALCMVAVARLVEYRSVAR